MIAYFVSSLRVMSFGGCTGLSSSLPAGSGRRRELARKGINLRFKSEESSRCRDAGTSSEIPGEIIRAYDARMCSLAGPQTFVCTPCEGMVGQRPMDITEAISVELWFKKSQGESACKPLEGRGMQNVLWSACLRDGAACAAETRHRLLLAEERFVELDIPQRKEASCRR